MDALMRQTQSVGTPDRYSRDLLYENLASWEAHVAIWFHDVEPRESSQASRWQR
jgi:hypothetical protein